MAAPPAPRWGLLLINLGTPEAPRTPEVRRYLREFLSDPRVIDIAPWRRWLLVNAAVAPFRSPRTAAAYRLIWTERGSPLRFHGEDLAEKLRARLGVPVALAMRYGQPRIAAGLRALRDAGADRVVVFPLFPQYASSSWGSAVAEVYRAAGALEAVPSVQVVPPYYEHPAFVSAFAGRARSVLAALRPDRVLFSFHGLPERHMRQADLSPGRCLASADCCARIGDANRFCYRAHCFATARALAAALDLPAEAWEICFQSRLGREPWLRPFTDVRLEELPQEGAKRVVVISAAFVADCLETLEELALRGEAAFLAAGGEAFAVVPCLNAADAWADAVVTIVGEVVPAAGDRAAAS